jgi:hypothetical protein
MRIDACSEDNQDPAANSKMAFVQIEEALRIQKEKSNQMEEEINKLKEQMATLFKTKMDKTNSALLLTRSEIPPPNSFEKTVKTFKHHFIGPRGIVTAYSVGDSAAEVTLIRDDLREALGIEGIPEAINLAWTDDVTKIRMATKIDLVVQGILKHSESIILRNCYAIDDLILPTRSLDMRVMRRKFPYLEGVDFEGYDEEQPVMLIGSPHAFAIESIKKLIGGGTGKPVAIESKLGVSVYGGNPDETKFEPTDVQPLTTEDTNKVSESVEIHFDELLTQNRRHTASSTQWDKPRNQDEELAASVDEHVTLIEEPTDSRKRPKPPSDVQA